MNPVRLLVAVVACLALSPAPQGPSATVSVRIPDTGLNLELTYRQISPDLQAYVEPVGVDAPGLHRLRVRALQTFAGQLRVDVPFRLGDSLRPKGRYPLAFTVDQGGVLRFFLVDGREAVPLASEGWQPAWDSPRMLMQILYVDRSEAHLLWHLDDRAGRVTLKLGARAR